MVCKLTPPNKKGKKTSCVVCSDCAQLVGMGTPQVRYEPGLLQLLPLTDGPRQQPVLDMDLKSWVLIFRQW